MHLKVTLRLVQSGKAISIILYECVFVALVTRHAHEPYCHLWSVWLYNIFPHYLKKGTILGGKNVLKIKYILIFFTTFV